MTYQIVTHDGRVLSTFDRFMEAKRAVDEMRAEFDYLEVYGSLQIVVYDDAGDLVNLARPIL